MGCEQTYEVFASSAVFTVLCGDVMVYIRKMVTVKEIHWFLSPIGDKGQV